MPPLLIFLRKKFNPEYLVDKSPDAWGEFEPSVWMTLEIFLKWFKKFIEFSHASLSNRVLLLLDNHSTHDQNMEILDLAEENGVDIVSFPPHTSDKLQPCDVGFNKPLSNAMTKEINKCIKTQNNRPISIKQIFGLFDKAFTSAATMQTAKNTFKKLGLFPFDKNVLKSFDFSAALNSDNEDLHSNNHTVARDDSINQLSSTESLTPEIPSPSMHENEQKETLPTKKNNSSGNSKYIFLIFTMFLSHILIFTDVSEKKFC